MPGIYVDSLLKRFGGSVALDNLSFEVREGEFISLLGPSGCGKTTTLRCIAGLERGDRGTIRIGETLVSDFGANQIAPPEQRGIGMVFQSYAIWPHMTVFRNVAYPLVARGASKDKIDSAVHEMLKLVDMAGYADRPATNLSGGQQQRVALARALVARPRVLLLDEPLSNLDAKLRDQMRIELREIQQRLGVTAVYVTHDQSEAMALSDRVIVMNRGRIEQIGQPREIYQSPSTAFVASFVGASNFLQGEVGEREGGLARVTLASGNRISVPDKGLSGKVQVALRPHFCAARPATSPVPKGANALDGKLARVTYFGERSEAAVIVDGRELLVYLPFDSSLNVGDDVLVTFAPADCIPLPA
jgi:ABC-type Fe3+/spermidine/putrescine transport system ATPase subunit